ncbi:MAG: hypothetical protein CM1200mP26_15720 [Acidimicrobiales bacterium]|nr:MAG: hypothetical protein CM1200mP26_15720 [Acidimicrobiales bacterium]
MTVAAGAEGIVVDGTRVIGPVEAALRARRDSGGKCLVVYVTGGLGADWLETARAVAAAGADVIEIGVPFSDPVMDGPTIQAANDVALDSGGPRRSESWMLSGRGMWASRWPL